MKKMILLTILLLSVGFSVNADYRASDYDPDYLPYNFEQANEALKSCEEKIEVFDQEYWALNQKIKNISSAPGQTIYQAQNEISAVYSVLDTLKSTYQVEFKECLDDEDDRLEQIAQKKEKEEEIEKAEERARQVAVAVERCDFDFFETFSNAEKMETYDGRMACEEKDNEPESEPIEITSISAPTPEPLVVEPVVSNYVPLVPVEQVSLEPELEVTDEEVSTTTPTTTEETIELTQEELDRIVEDKLNEKLNEAQSEPEPAPKPSFFKRVTNFLFGWMF